MDLMRRNTIKALDLQRFSISDVRQRLIWRIDRRYSSRLASYIKALVIGYKDAQFADYTSAYKTIGLLHLFTLSGMHIQFYLGGVHLLLKRAGLVRETRLLLLSAVGLLLIILTGSGFEFSHCFCLFDPRNPAFKT